VRLIDYDTRPTPTFTRVSFLPRTHIIFDRIIQLFKGFRSSPREPDLVKKKTNKRTNKQTRTSQKNGHDRKSRFYCRHVHRISNASCRDVRLDSATRVTRPRTSPSVARRPYRPSADWQRDVEMFVFAAPQMTDVWKHVRTFQFVVSGFDGRYSHDHSDFSCPCRDTDLRERLRFSPTVLRVRTTFLWTRVAAFRVARGGGEGEPTCIDQHHVRCAFCRRLGSKFWTKRYD